ncbi:g2134 [Coccomyxa viridis]|uniref:G2134 protein n=1 Tax=Coccomyxa viridis TaxID=1274662 RepID=A0ABP1FPU8_9CHLO
MSGPQGYVARSPNIDATPLRPEAERKARWKVELPSSDSIDEQWGGCRGVESAYEKTNQIGEGTYGQVYLATDKQNGDQVALKKIRMDTEKEGFPITAIREIKLLKNLHHANIINLREIVRSQTHKCNNFKGSIYMVFDYMDHDLTGLMERLNHRIPTRQMKCYMKQLMRGLAHCHTHNVLHRDLKAANLLTNNKGQLKLADFGLARTFRDREDGKMTNRVITLWYRPPELLMGSTHYGPEIDMWSVGCIFAELLYGKTLFNGQEESDQLTKIFKAFGTPTEADWPGVSKLQIYHNVKKQPPHRGGFRGFLETKFPGKQTRDLPAGALDLLERMLRLDPKKRISAMEAFKDDFFWSIMPLPFEETEMPTFDASHELDMKRKRHADRGQRQEGQAQAHQGTHDAKRQRTTHNANTGYNQQHYAQQQQHSSYPAPGSHVRPTPMPAIAYGAQPVAYAAASMYPPQQQAGYGAPGQYPGQMAGRPPVHGTRPARVDPLSYMPQQQPMRPGAPYANSGAVRPLQGPGPAYPGAAGRPGGPTSYGPGAPPGYVGPASQGPSWQRQRR